jgi:uncharacterized membrane protein
VKRHGARTFFGAGAVVLTVAYPFAVYFLMGRGGVRYAGLALLAILAMRILTPNPRRGQMLGMLAAGALFAVAIVVTSNETLARLYPVAVNATLLATFGYSLLHPPAVLERLVRATGVELDDSARLYLRKLTAVWCVFFFLNGAIALATALLGTREVWVIYNGLVSYLIAGSIFLGEKLVRQWVLSRPARNAG